MFMRNCWLAGTFLALLTSIPLAWKWRLGIPRTCCAISAVSTLSVVLVGAIENSLELGAWMCAAAVWILTIGSVSLLLVYRFYRDPERQAPEREDVVVSPADGVVIYIVESRAGTLPVSNKHGRRYPLAELTRTTIDSAESVVVGISMNLADVHVNRAPIGGRITSCRHFPGRFGSLRKPEMVFENVRATTLITGQRMEVAVVQIASRLVRQIALFVHEGEEIAMGQRIGAIRFGSQVDLVVPIRNDLRITTRVGERVRAGESIVAVLENRTSR
jgi:phosphatidylserine decarboxylase